MRRAYEEVSFLTLNPCSHPKQHTQYRETSVMRYVLKHLRQRRLLTPFQTILSRAGIQLEHPLITQLYDSIVLQGDWSRAEQLLERISSAGLYDSYLQSCQAFATWNRLTGTDADGDVPPARGGHAMCIDPINQMIYIFGGWNGEKSLDDFWVYNIPEDKWRLLSHSTTQEHNAPGARSCHKMVFDTKTGSIYVLGRLNDSDGLREPNSWARLRGVAGPGYPGHPRTQEGAALNGGSDTKTYCSEFYRYHTRGLLAGKWDFLSIDTAVSLSLMHFFSVFTLFPGIRGTAPGFRPPNGYGFGSSGSVFLRWSSSRR